MAPPPSAHPTPAAVFLSYAREDLEAARRIAEALRSQGIEVWFDLNELRGGDAWDQKIRRQIKECTLFLPVLSAQTLERGEGYFRLEWKLAVERSHLMAEGLPFLVPVVVDGTSEDAGMVPEPFLQVQWTRLPGALPTPEFIAQIKRLLAAPQKNVGRDRDKGSSLGGPIPPRPLQAGSGDPARQPKPAVPGWMWGVLAVVLVGVAAGFFVLRKPEPSVASSQSTTEIKPAAPAVTAADAKSIAVLPFTNMSEDKDTGFFADGVHEDLLTNLALVAELKVISRTSVLQYRGTTKTMRLIGSELGVAYLLEGSVRRAGNKVRVTGQLINTRTDEHVWAKSYDRDLTDIFAIQSAIAQEIASALSAAISPETKKQLDRRPTENTTAYDLYLQGRSVRNLAPTSSNTALTQAAALYQHAVDLDPNFAAAWGELAVVHALMIFWDRDASAERKAKGDAAIAAAVRLAPDAPEVTRLSGTYAYYAYRDYAKATAQYEKIIRLQPNDPTGYASLGLIQRRQGRWAESLASLQRAIELDPANVSYTRNLLATYTYIRRWDEARAMQRRLISLLPDQLREELASADTEFAATGKFKAVDELLARLTPAQKDSPVAIYYRKNWAWLRDDYTEFQRLDQLQPTYAELERPVWPATYAGMMHLAHGDAAAAQARIAESYAETKALTEQEPGNLRAWLFLGVMEAILGHKEEAVRLTQKVVDLLPESRDAVDGSSTRSFLVWVYALTGDKERAIAEIAHTIQTPNQYSIYRIRNDPACFSLRGDPRFEALVNDPKNNAPLY